MKITIPTDISDITISQHKKYLKLKKREDDITPNEFNKRAISIFTNLPYHTIEKIKVSDYLVLVEDIIKALETPALFKNKFELKGIEYGFITNFDEISQGEWIDIIEYQKDENEINKLMAILFRPIVKSDPFGNYEIKSYTGTGERATLFEDMPMSIVNGALGFFLTLSSELKTHIQRSTIVELQKVARV